MSAAGLRKILTCQRVALLGCMPVCRTVSTDALQVLLGVPPLDLEVTRRGIAFKIKRGLPLVECDWVTSLDVSQDVMRNKALLLERLISRWQTRWNESPNGRVTYSFIPDVTFVFSRPNFGFGLSLGFILTGHGSLNAFLHKRGLSDTAECACGRGPENSVHVLTQCPFYEDIRDTDRMGMVFVDGRWDFSRCLEDEGTFRALDVFSKEIFNRRRAAVL